MARERIHLQWVTSNGWVVPAGLGLALWLGNLSEETSSWFFCAAARLAVEALPSVILAGWQLTQAPAWGHRILEGLVLQVLGSSWPLLLKLAGAA
jgi:hypothetical protein